MHMGEAKWDIEGPIEVAGVEATTRLFPCLLAQMTHSARPLFHHEDKASIKADASARWW